MNIEYVGRQQPHRERLYGSKILFAGPGDVQAVDDEIGRKMVNKHPDQYAEVAREPGVAGGGHPQAASKAEPQPKQESGPTEPGTILINGESHEIKGVSKDVLIDIAKKHYETDIPVRTGKPEVVETLTALVADYGQPKE